VQISLQPLCLLYAAFMVKHFLCDYPLQTAWMAKGKGTVTGWQAPLAAHAAMHAAGTLVIALATVPALAWLAIVGRPHQILRDPWHVARPAAVLVGARSRPGRASGDTFLFRDRFANAALSILRKCHSSVSGCSFYTSP
jgi:hypothetical protein